MRKEAAPSPGQDESISYPINDETMTATASRCQAREGHMMIYNERPTHPVCRFTLGVALAVLALILAPTLVDQYAGSAPQQVVRESAAAPLAPEGATQAPAAFSDALAAAPAGAQCSVEAHACTVPGAQSEAALSSNNNETAVAYGFMRTTRGASYNQRM